MTDRLPDPRLLGTRALNVEVEWRWRFVPVGTRASTTPGVLYLDVGGTLSPGIVDHHDGGNTSTAELVFAHRELVYAHLLGPLLQDHAKGSPIAERRLTLTVVTHFEPDFDGMVSAYLVRRLVEDGDFPPGAQSLVAYVGQVDQGHYRIRVERPATFWAPHLAYLALQHLPATGDRSARSLAVLQRGMELLDLVRSHAGLSDLAADDFDAPPLRWRDEPRYQDVVELLSEEPARYEADRQRADLRTVVLPTEQGSPTTAAAFLLNEPPTSRLNKYWVRADGFALFVCPYATRPEDGDGRWSRVVVSVDPTHRTEDGNKLSLRGLGHALERAESSARRARNGGIDDRGNVPRWSDGSCDNPDPWYDGRGHDWTIVDAPQTGTALSLATIVEILESGTFWHVEVPSVSVTLVWRATPVESSRTGDGSAVPEGLTPRLSSYYRELRRVTLPAPELSAPEFHLARERLDFPTAERGALEVVRLRTTRSTTLERLVEAHMTLTKGRAPDYALVHLELRGTEQRPHVARLLSTLGDVSVNGAPLPDDEGEQLLFLNHELLVVQAPSPTARTSTYEEVLLYLAFVDTSLRTFRDRVAELLLARKSGGGHSEKLRRDLLTFQATHLDLDVAPRGAMRGVAARLSGAMSVDRTYAEVQDLMRQLAQLEERDDARASAQANHVLEAVLFLLGISGVYQLIMAFLRWPTFHRSDYVWLGGVPLAFLLVLGFAWHIRRRRR